MKRYFVFLRPFGLRLEEGAPLKVPDLVVSGSRMILEGIQPVKIGGLLESLWRECVVNPKLNNEEWLVAQIKKHADDGETASEV